MNENNNQNVINNNGTVQNTQTPQVVQPNVPVQNNVLQQNNNQPVNQPVQSNTETQTINTEKIVKKKKGSNFVIYLILILLMACVFYIDEVIIYYDSYIKPKLAEFIPFMNTGTVTTTNNSKSSDDGYIKIGDNNGSVTIGGYQFSNFKKDSNSLTFSYTLLNSADIAIYIELYDENKSLLYKSLFNANNLEKNQTTSYKLDLKNDVYDLITYAVMSINSKSSTESLTCSYTYKENDKEVLSYLKTYNFENDLLVSYSVNEELKDSSSTKKTELDSEYNSLPKELGAVYSENKLSYTVSLSNLPEGFTSSYESSYSKNLIKTLEEKNADWKCE